MANDSRAREERLENTDAAQSTTFSCLSIELY